MPNLESLNQWGTGRESSDSQVGWYCADKFVLNNNKVQTTDKAFAKQLIIFMIANALVLKKKDSNISYADVIEIYPFLRCH